MPDPVARVRQTSRRPSSSHGTTAKPGPSKPRRNRPMNILRRDLDGPRMPPTAESRIMPALGGPDVVCEQHEQDNNLTRGRKGIYTRPSGGPGPGSDLETGCLRVPSSSAILSASLPIRLSQRMPRGSEGKPERLIWQKHLGQADRASFKFRGENWAVVDLPHGSCPTSEPIDHESMSWLSLSLPSTGPLHEQTPCLQSGQIIER